MSNRSYPADFSRPLREVPVATDEDVQRMLERLRRRCKIGKVSVMPVVDQAGRSLEIPPEVQGEMWAASPPSDPVHDSSGELREPNLHQAQLPDGAKPSPRAVANIDAGANPAGALDGRVAPTLKQTPSAGGECTNAAALSSASIPSTRPAPLEWKRISPYAMRTTCGTWTCCKVTVGEYPRYELWRRIAGLERPVCVKRGMTAFLEAQDLAEAESCV